MELKPKQIEMPNHRTQVNDVISVHKQQIQTDKKNTDKKNDESFVKSGDIIGCSWNCIYFVSIGLLGMFVLFSQKNHIGQDTLSLIFEGIEENNLIVVPSFVGLWCVCWLYVKYIRQNLFLKQEQMAIKKETERLNGTNDNRFYEIIVNDRKLTPEETKNFVKKAKKFANEFLYFFAFFAVLKIILGNVLSGIITFAVFFFIRKKFLSALDKAEEDTKKEYIENPPSFKAEQDDGCFDENRKKATPADSNRIYLILYVFICFCFYIFVESSIGAVFMCLLVARILFSIVKQIQQDTIVKQIQQDTSKPTEKDKI